MTNVQQEDIQAFAQNFALREQLRGATVLVTGATGLIGSSLIHSMIALQVDIQIIAPIRNLKKAITIYDEEERTFIRFIECDIAHYDYSQIEQIDYIIHCAAPTSSRFFVEHPVETFDIILEGTRAMLECARTHESKGLVYLSSLEIYGEVHDDNIAITEDKQGFLDIMSTRSSYPMAKRATETLCCLYANQYGTPAMVARLTQTTGAGIAADDNRVIALFSRLAVNNQDIVLHTTGESSRPYCYTTDAVSAILYILLRGQKGEAYNIANEESYTSAKQLAEYIRDNFNPNINVRIELNDQMGYAPATKLRLSTDKIQSLGWKPRYGLQQIIERLIEYIKDTK